MRITIIGPGGVGGFFGARLARGGCDVRFVGRGQHLEAMRRNGLRVHGGLGELTIQSSSIRASDNAQEFGPADVVLICVKLWDTEDALRLLPPVVEEETMVVSLQNGVQKEEVLRASLGDHPVVGGVSYVAAKIEGPGVIYQMGNLHRLVFGECDGQPSPRTEAFLQACLRSGIKSEISSDIRRSIWEKFVFLIGLSGATSAMRSNLGPIRSNPKAWSFLAELMREVVDVGRAHGVRLTEDFAEERLRFIEGLSPETTSSMHTDLEQGKRLEIDWLSAAVVDLGKTVGIPTPMNEAVAAILAVHAQGKATEPSNNHLSEK